MGLFQNRPIVKVERAASAEPVAPTDRPPQLGSGGIVLIPQPSSDPRDPLNWPFRKKATITATLFLALFVGFSGPFCGQLNLQQQAELYHKETVQITYFNSAASAGLATGGFVWWPLSYKLGRSATILWSTLGLLAAQVWATLMTHGGQYVPYLVSRFFAAFCGVVVGVLGPPYLVDMFFLHQRGRAFNVLHLALNLGASAGPTFSGFVAAGRYWPVEYYWHIALTATAAVVVFVFLEDTDFDRTEGAVNRPLSDGFVRSRIETFFRRRPGEEKRTWKETVKRAATPFKIAVAPVVLVIAGFDSISFGFYVALNALTPVWLQTPTSEGGRYGFSVSENAAFTFVHWIGLAVGLVYGHYVSDAIPLRLAGLHRGGNGSGRWKPEYRLHALWPTGLVLLPLGLGLVGVAAQRGLHWAVMAAGQLLVTIGSLVSIPVTVNYACECFVRAHAAEAALVLNSMRLLLGLSVNFYVQPWIAAVGVGWVYGTQALLCLVAFGFLALLMFWGPRVRALSPFHSRESEEGEAVLARG